MATIHLNFDDRTLARVRRLAEARRITVEAFLADMLERFEAVDDSDRVGLPPG